MSEYIYTHSDITINHKNTTNITNNNLGDFKTLTPTLILIIIIILLQHLLILVLLIINI